MAARKPFVWPHRLFAAAVGCLFLWLGIWGSLGGVVHWTYAVWLVLMGAASIESAISARYGLFAQGATAVASTMLLVIGVGALIRANFAAGAYMVGLGAVGVSLLIGDIRHSRVQRRFR